MRRLALPLVVLALAAPASAAAAPPRFALWDLQTDLSTASRNVYGDVDAKPLAAVATRGTPVHCAAWCRFGSGWLAFRTAPRLDAADVAGARVAYARRKGWFVDLTLRPAAAPRWAAFAAHVRNGTRLRGVPDVLVVVAGGQIAAAPLATEVTSARGVVTLTGFSRPGAKALARLLG